LSQPIRPYARCKRGKIAKEASLPGVRVDDAARQSDFAPISRVRVPWILFVKRLTLPFRYGVILRTCLSYFGHGDNRMGDDAFIIA